MNKIRNLDIFFVIVGLVLIWSGQNNIVGTATFMIAFGGAMIGSALTLMSVRTNRKKKNG